MAGLLSCAYFCNCNSMPAGRNQGRKVGQSLSLQWCALGCLFLLRGVLTVLFWRITDRHRQGKAIQCFFSFYIVILPQVLRNLPVGRMRKTARSLMPNLRKASRNFDV